MKYKFKSKRLGFRQWMINDIKPFYDMNNSKEVMKHFPNTLSILESKNLISKIHKSLEKNGFGLYAIDKLKTKEFIGMIGFHKPSFELGFGPFIEISWRIKVNQWNKGLATEGAKKCLEFGFKNLNFKDIYSLTAKSNSPSERIMQKIGMKKITEFEHPHIMIGNHLKTHVLYKIEKNEYLQPNS